MISPTKPSRIDLQSTQMLVIFCLGFGLFISKPVIYAASGLLVLMFLIQLLKYKDYRAIASQNRWILASVVLYIFGLIATLIYPTHWADLSLYARKGLFLLVFAAMWMACRSTNCRRAAMAGLMIGFWTTALLTAVEIAETGWIYRIGSSAWPVDIWGVLCALFALFLLPLTLSRTTPTWQCLALAITLLSALIFLVLSGSRGPLLGCAMAIFLYLLICQRKVLLLLSISLLLAYWPAKELLPERMATIESRITSITETKGNDSNWIRLTLWKLTLAQDAEKLKSSPLTLLFGSGPAHHVNEIREFFSKTEVLTASEKEKLSSWNYPSNDVHNMYLDSVAKMGVVWTVAVLAFLVGLLWMSWRNRQISDGLSLSASLVLIGFLVTGVFYDAMLHFDSLFMIYFVTLGLSFTHSALPQLKM
jgi:O-antigen ligase